MEQYQNLALTLLRELCVIPAPSHHEEKRAAYCLEKLHAFGFDQAYMDAEKNVVCVLPGQQTDETVIFAAHTDVVFPDTEALPFWEDDEKIYCPGCGDDTTCVAQLLSVMKKCKDQAATPRCNMVFVFNSCEEGLGNLKGIRSIFSRYGENTTAFFTFDGKYSTLVERSVGSHRYRVTVRTAGGHSFNDFGKENAGRVLAEGIAQIYKIPMPLGGKTTCNVGMISGGTSVNTIMQEASMLCEYRSDCYEDLQYMKGAFEKIFASMGETAQVETELVGERPGMKNVDPVAQKNLSDLCAKIQKAHSGVALVRVSGSTDCNIPHSLGIPAVCVGTYMGGGAHTREEWVKKASVALGVGIIADLVETFFM